MTVEVEKLLDRVDWREVFGQIASYYYQEFADMFATRGANRGHKWPELAESTLQGTVLVQTRRVRREARGDILQNTGLLRGSLTARKREGSRFEVGARELVLGTSVPYAVYHDSDAPRTKLPQRKLLKIIHRDIEVIKGRIREGIIKAAERAGHDVEIRGGPVT